MPKFYICLTVVKTLLSIQTPVLFEIGNRERRAFTVQLSVEHLLVSWSKYVMVMLSFSQHHHIFEHHARLYKAGISDQSTISAYNMRRSSVVIERLVISWRLNSVGRRNMLTAASVKRWRNAVYKLLLSFLFFYACISNWLPCVIATALSWTQYTQTFCRCDYTFLACFIVGITRT